MTRRRPQVFISYQRTDRDVACRVREHLRADGFSTWMDRFDIPVGAYWPDEIDRALDSSDTVVGILSPDAAASRNVKNEWDWAIANHRRLVLLQVAACTVPHRYVAINFIDATGPDLDRALAELLRSSVLLAERAFTAGSRRFWPVPTVAGPPVPCV
ncbi:MAG: toll/interleukin-1 receptor domain-containing protein [Chloroflexota bacterium]|nr:toll/interleukin-1 receptor domain-containing protein [Chloroflexota bacterium]